MMKMMAIIERPLLTNEFSNALCALHCEHYIFMPFLSIASKLVSRFIGKKHFLSLPFLLVEDLKKYLVMDHYCMGFKNLSHG